MSGFTYAGTVRFVAVLRNVNAQTEARYLPKKLSTSHLVELGNGEAMMFRTRGAAEKFLARWADEFKGYRIEMVRA